MIKSTLESWLGKQLEGAGVGGGERLPASGES